MFIFNAIIFVLTNSILFNQISSEPLTGDGVCTSLKTKQVPVSKVAAHNEVETYWGKCPGYYFKKCVLERTQVKTRINYELETQTIVNRRCCEGYAEIKGSCVPHCALGCVFGNCTGPNECTCYEGYVMEKQNKCVPHCEGCSHGECKSPNLCQCNEGYDWDSKRSECQPRCSSGCPNGDCTAPETCECNEGYRLHHTNICIPHCETKCFNGICIAPDMCECKHGYQFVNDSNTDCEPVCSNECKNGKCVEPNVCSCDDGYQKHESGECLCGKFCVEIEDRCHCLDESQRVKGMSLFDVCDEDNCFNGKCTSALHCECSDGYVKNENNTCIANDTCLEGECQSTEDNLAPGKSTILCECINGVCSSNNTCFCISGYKLDTKVPNRCVPNCERNCINGFCTEPNLCECFIGYKNSDNETDYNICIPICDLESEDWGCSNGTCIGPEVCKCFEGFEISTESNFTCVPIKMSAESSFLSKSFTSLAVLIVIAALVAAVYVIYKRHQMHSLRVYQDNQYSTEPISVCTEHSEEL